MNEGLTPDRLQAFTTLAEELHFTRTAARLHVAQPALTKRIQQACFDRNLLVLTAGTYVNVIRIIPPLVTSADEVDRALGIFAEALDVAGA